MKKHDSRHTTYTAWLRSDRPTDRVMVIECDHRYDAALAQTARRCGVKVRTAKGVAVYGLDTAPVIRVSKVDV